MPGTRIRRFLVPAAAAAGTVVLDQWTKCAVVRAFALFEAKPVVAGFFDIVHVRNTGVAFGMFSSLGHGWLNPILVGVTAVAVGGLLTYIYFHPDRGVAPAGLGLVLGGAVGNLIDRARQGYVVDFLDVSFRGHHWPAFNVADIGITVGVGLLLLDLLVGQKPDTV